MFQEVLRIKPVLEPASAKRMETSLSQRFNRVAKRFSTGLKAVVSGTALGIGLNILAKILNPIQELEERMNALLGKGKSTLDLADRFGTSAGKLMRLQTVGERLGVDPSDLQSMMQKYAEAIETGREELTKPLKDQSEATRILSQDFLDQKDMAESFFKFIQSLRNVTDQNERARIEKEVLGERLYGYKRRFTDADFEKELRSVPSAQEFNMATGKAVMTDEDVRIQRVNREAQQYLKEAGTLGPGTVNAIGALEQARTNKEIKEFAKFNTMATTARGVEEAMNALKTPLVELQVGIAKLVVFIEKLSQSRWFRNVIGN